MIIHVGPKKKEQFKEIIISKINNLKTIFFVFFILLPCLVYVSFKFNWFSSGSFSNQDITASVAKVITGDGTGTAFLISPTKLITAKHVVVLSGLSEGAYVELEFIKAPASVGKRRAKVLFIPNERGNDFAILELDRPISELQTLEKGNSDDVEINEQINIIGYPAGMFSSTIGTVSNNILPESLDLLEVNAGAWPGSSGGPIISKETNEVIGILIAGFEESQKGRNFGFKINSIFNNSELKARGIDFNR
jgi:S1-C subfamily serine protease